MLFRSGGKLSLASPMLFACGFLSLFLIGGLTGIMLGAAPFDFQLQDTYFLIGHFHFVLIGGTLFGVFAGIHYWFPKMTGRMLSERLARWQFWLLYVGFLLTFGTMHISGVLGMPRRIYTYDADRGWALLNQLTTLGAIIQVPSFVLFVWNVFASLRYNVISRGHHLRSIWVVRALVLLVVASAAAAIAARLFGGWN